MYHLAQVNTARALAPLHDPRLKAFVYNGSHAQIMRRRREWFVPIKGAYIAL